MDYSNSIIPYVLENQKFFELELEVSIVTRNIYN